MTGPRVRDSQPTCECGCGEIPKAGNRFLHGHNNRARFGAGENNVRWMGDDAGRSAIHKWLNKYHPLRGACEECGAKGGRTEWSNVDHTWRREIADYRELCARCHRHYDFTELGTPNPCLERAVA